MSRRFLLLYASQTGQSEAIAKNEIHAVAEDHDLSPAIFCMSQTEKKVTTTPTLSNQPSPFV